jgi:hypothetical protein
LRATHLGILIVEKIDSCAGQQGSFERLKKTNSVEKLKTFAPKGKG